MQNLAGNKEADKHISRELERCGIPTVYLKDPHPGEVHQTVTGDLPGFKMRRAWYYWVVEGPVPLAVARELYEDPVGKTDIRVAGHCGCLPPEEWITWREPQTKRQVIARKEFDEIKVYVDKKLLTQESLDKYVALDATLHVPVPVIETYHIDSELGLYIFVNTLRKRGVI